MRLAGIKDLVLREALQELEERLAKFETANLNLGGRKIGGAGDASSPSEYVTLRQLLDTIKNIDVSGGPSTVASIDAQWIFPDFISSGPAHARGAVPDPGVTPGTTRYLREDATFAVPPGGAAGTPGPMGPPGSDGGEGADGPPGPPGDTGSPGPAGPQGLFGPPGFEGPEGDEGLMGPPGVAGVDGAPGAAGPMGAAGPPGYGTDGEDGLMGPPGAAGINGAPGAAGVQGQMGPPGFGVDGEDGYSGPPGQAGASGAPGATGAAGAIGPPGYDGSDGSDGYTIPGPAGVAGASGPPGAAGVAGSMGPPGSDGEEGMMGPPGPFMSHAPTHLENGGDPIRPLFLKFGGTSSSFPGLKRNTNFLEARLADDSAYSSLVVDTLAVISFLQATTGGTLPAMGQIRIDSGFTPSFTCRNAANGADLTMLARDGSDNITSKGNIIETQNNKAAANGYASLDGSTLVPVAQIPAHDIITKHNGFPGGTSTFLRADGTFAAAGGAGADPPEGSYAPGSYTIATGKFRVAAGRQQFTGSQRLTIAGTARLSIYN